MKSADSGDPDRTPTDGEIERELIALGIITSPASAEQYANADPVAFGAGTNGNESKALAERLVDETGAINAAFNMAEKRMVVDRKGAAPIQIASFEC